MEKVLPLQSPSKPELVFLDQEETLLLKVNTQALTPWLQLDPTFDKITGAIESVVDGDMELPPFDPGPKLHSEASVGRLGSGCAGGGYYGCCVSSIFGLETPPWLSKALSYITFT
ncbi:Hypothetical predicted protein [Xyrichtys novacula]|uniref:Uncharacterized protein n=1 Tax=Xyrichtys novacula TaxID=13765 RepID=A0AAV1G7V0_XYRNO|nr:Hypothetical predicted protein [Xyrichtys novacula]